MKVLGEIGLVTDRMREDVRSESQSNACNITEHVYVVLSDFNISKDTEADSGLTSERSYHECETDT